MDTAALIDQLADNGARLGAAAELAGFDARVPGLEWDVRRLVTHTAGVHRWAAAIVSRAPQDQVDAAGAAVEVGPDDAELLGWFYDGLALVVGSLRTAPDDLQAFTLLRADSAKHFWARRQAHETAIHRVDAEGAAGVATELDAQFAQDGIEELLAFARGRPFALARDSTLALRSELGPSWLLRFGGERTVVTDAEGPADCTVTGTLDDLYRWVWNRPGGAAVTGDAVVAADWARTVRITR